MAYNFWQVHWNAEALLLWAKQPVCCVHPFPAPWRVSPTSHRLHPDRLSKNLSHLPLSVIYTHMLLNALNKEYLWCNFLTTDNTSAAPCWWVKNAYFISLSSQLVLIPRYEELPGFQGDDAPDERRRQEMEVYMCLDSFTTLPMPALAELCTTLICSISAIMHNGALGESLWWGQRINVLPQCPVKTSHIITHPFLFPSDKSHTVV